MAQAVVLQTEILANDVSAVDVIWMEVLKNQERLQSSYHSKTNELVDTFKRRQSERGSGGGGGSTSHVNRETTQNVDGSNPNNKIINQGYKIGISINKWPR